MFPVPETRKIFSWRSAEAAACDVKSLAANAAAGTQITHQNLTF